jgi:DNA-binding IclR family transcriptional regulator
MKSIRKATEVLKLLAAPPHEISVSDAARALGVTPSNASRILGALRDSELIDQDPGTRRYRPGPLAAQIAAGFRRGGDLLATVETAMAPLVQETSHTGWLGVLSGAEVVVLRTLHGGFPVRFGVELGSRLPAHAAAMGKALLARLDDAEVRRRCGARLKARTGRTAKDIATLIADLGRIRARGYAVSDQELFQGIRSIAVAFMRPGEEEAVALSLSYPVFSVPEGAETSLIAALLRHARRIGGKIGDPRWVGAAVA